jgi:hypothetical protein
MAWRMAYGEVIWAYSGALGSLQPRPRRRVAAAAENKGTHGRDVHTRHGLRRCFVKQEVSPMYVFARHFGSCTFERAYWVCRPRVASKIHLPPCRTSRATVDTLVLRSRA